MSDTVKVTATLSPCRIPIEVLRARARKFCEDAEDGGQIAEAFKDLAIDWKLDNPDSRESECPFPALEFLSGKMYEVEHFKEEEADHFSLTPTDGGSFDMVAIYYNGGAHWAEMAESALNELHEEERQ